jgi:predicted outer membrane repeat protein
VDHPSRSPLVSDLPKLEMEIVDAVDVRLDVTYAEEAGTSFQYGSQLTKSTTTSTSRYNENSINLGVEIGYTFEVGLFPEGSVSSKLSFDYGQKWSTTETSSQTAQQSHSEYTTDSRTRTETAATGSMSAGIRLRNPGDITYTLSTVGITVRHWEIGWDEAQGQLVKNFQTVATLVPVLDGGITLAPGEETPVLQVAATDLNPDRVKELLRRPDSLYLETGYFELENADHVNFDFLTEVNAGQTAAIIIDPGQSNAEEYRVATNVRRGFGGTFPGIPLGDILSDILDIDYTTIERRHVEPAAPTNERVLLSLQGLQTDLGNYPDGGFWVVVHESEHPTSGLYDFDEVPVRAGDRVVMIYVRDDDADGLNALEEQHYGTFAGSVDDSDGDGLSDHDEVRVGWQVAWTDVGATVHEYSVLSDPTSIDQDRDGLEDSDEMALGTNPSTPDTDRDGIPDGEDPWPLYQARVIYVDQNSPADDGSCSSWENACTHLQDALSLAYDAYRYGNDPADDVAEIWVADGIYKPHETDPTAYFRLVSTVGVYGGFSGNETKRSQREKDPRLNDTILSGDLDASGNSYRVVFSMDPLTLLDGFLITGGNSVPHSDHAGGIFIEGGPVTLRNLFFVGNQGIRGGALYAQWGIVHLTNCVFSNNTANYDVNRGGGGAMYVTYNSAIDIDGCRFIGNATAAGGSGGAIYSQAESLTVKNTDFQYNDAATNQANTANGGAIHAYQANNLIVDNCRFIGNRANYRGGAISSASFSATTRMRVLNSLFWQNEAIMTTHPSRGGAIWTQDDTRLSIVNCTLAENRVNEPSSQGGGICVQSLPYPDSLLIENSILWGNRAGDPDVFAAQVALYSGDWNDRIINSSCVEGIETIRFEPQFGLGCIWDDPQFEGTSGTLALGSNSPCIDTGNTFVDADPLSPGFQALPQTDLAGEPRIVDGDEDGLVDVDMGAYEYQP